MPVLAGIATCVDIN